MWLLANMIHGVANMMCNEANMMRGVADMMTEGGVVDQVDQYQCHNPNPFMEKSWFKMNI